MIGIVPVLMMGDNKIDVHSSPSIFAKVAIFFPPAFFIEGPLISATPPCLVFACIERFADHNYYLTMILAYAQVTQSLECVDNLLLSDNTVSCSQLLSKIQMLRRYNGLFSIHRRYQLYL